VDEDIAVDFVIVVPVLPPIARQFRHREPAVPSRCRLKVTLLSYQLNPAPEELLWLLLMLLMFQLAYLLCLPMLPPPLLPCLRLVWLVADSLGIQKNLELLQPLSLLLQL
jgi:hypothetical protein